MRLHLPHPLRTAHARRDAQRVQLQRAARRAHLDRHRGDVDWLELDRDREQQRQRRGRV